MDCVFSQLFKSDSMSFFWIILLVKLNIVALEITKDYCSWETFSATCQEDEVIVVHSAFFGLMERGRCVKRDFGFLGCSSDQLGFLDKQCSGHRQCEVLVGNEEIKANIPCPDHYLRASYSCEKVLKPNKDQCTGPVEVKVKSTPTRIASVTSLESQCGIGNSPWVITAQPGQKINITLTDFSWADTSGVDVKSGCVTLLGHVLYQGTNELVDICGGSTRVNHVALSSGHQVQVVLKENILQRFQFLLEFKAVGCVDLIPPRNAWMKKENDVIILGCQSNSKTWRLKCISNHWIGANANCSKVALPRKINIRTTAEEFSHHHVLAIGVGCLAFIMCCVTITIGVYCIRRYKIKVKSHYSKSATGTLLLPTSQFADDHRHNMTSQGLGSGGNIRQNSTLTGRHTIDHRQTLSDRHQEAVVGSRPSTGEELDSVQYFVLETPPGYNEGNVL